jgi:hypothetical protein
MLWTWFVVGAMFVGVVAALGYPLLRPRGRRAPAGQAEDLDAWIEEAVRARRRRAPAAPHGEVGTAVRPCPRCGAAPRPGDRFCRQCGAPLTRSCPRCGTPYEEGDRFCVQCGSPLGSVDG